MVNFPTQIPDSDSHNPALLDSIISSDPSICYTVAFPPLGNSDVAVWVSIDFPSNSKGDAPFHCIAYDFSHTNWNGLCDLWQRFDGRLSLNLVLMQLLWNFVSEAWSELMYIFLIVNIKSTLAHIHSFYQLVLLP